MKSLPRQRPKRKKLLAEFDEKFTFEGFPGFVKLQSYDNLVSITNKISKLSANNLIGQITNPISGSLDILAASAGGIGAAILSYAKLRDLFGELTDKDYFDTYISMAGIKSDVKNRTFRPRLPTRFTKTARLRKS